MYRYLLLLALFSLLACKAPGPLAADRDPDELFGSSDADLIVVDAILIVDAPLPPVVLRRTVAPGHSYSAVATALEGASVSIQRGDAMFNYRPDPSRAGHYLPPDDAPVVEPNGLYELRVTTGDGLTVRAQTQTPARIRIDELRLLADDLETELRRLRLFAEVGDAVYQAAENQLEYDKGVLIAQFQDDGPAVSYQVRLANLERSSPLLFDDEWIEDFEDFELERVETSPLLSLASGELYLPWAGIYYAGRYKVTLFAVDQNWFDLVRTDNVDAERGSGEAGQSFQRPLFHVENGIGLFASAAVDSFGFSVRP
ncbi:MAG: DUF4249 family protein [Gemmatimonadetes bacterium]|nr:DUF4249 family protein [Gemmatimonadota bacterium]